MGATLDALFKLQSIETQLTDHRKAIESRKRQVQVVSRRVEECLRNHQATLERAQERQVRSDSLELEVKSKEAEITKLREALNRAKSNKEYAAILTQINTGKADTAKQEELILQIMSEVEAVREQAKAHLEQAESEKGRLAGLQRALEEFETSSKGRIDELLKQREAVVAELPGEVLSVFERVAARHDGEAMAEVVQENPRRQEFSCGGCSMAVTLEQYSRLHEADEIVVCNSCGRILYLAR
jgi:hypothetical protein